MEIKGLRLGIFASAFVGSLAIAGCAGGDGSDGALGSVSAAIHRPAPATCTLRPMDGGCEIVCHKTSIPYPTVEWCSEEVETNDCSGTVEAVCGRCQNEDGIAFNCCFDPFRTDQDEYLCDPEPDPDMSEAHSEQGRGGV